MQMEKKMPHIPNDIVVQIFLRLSARSLVRIRWACKYLFNLITRDHDFIKMHIHSSTTTTHSDDDNDEILGIRNSTRRIGDLYQLFQRSLGYNHATGTVDVSSDEVCIALPLDRFFPMIYGSINGLILISLRERSSTCELIFCIWNLCTKEYRVLPHAPKHTDDGVPGYRDYYGFGYDHTTDDYKVLRYAYYCNNNGVLDLHEHYYSDIVQVYTLGTNSWKSIGIDPYSRFRLRSLHYQREGVFLNGALYWMDSLHQNIISIDIVKEKFQHVAKLPNLGDHDDEYWLQVFEGSLCVVALNIKSYRMAEIWIMNNYAENNNEYSWAKLTTISNLDDRYFSIKPLRFTRNGEILMVTNLRDLLLCEPKSSNVKILCRIHEKQPTRHCTIIVYSGSLVSLNSGTYMGQEQTKEEEGENDDAIMACRTE